MDDTRTVIIPKKIAKEVHERFDIINYVETRNNELAFSKKEYNPKDFKPKYHVYFSGENPVCIIKTIKTYKIEEIILSIGRMIAHINMKEFEENKQGKGKYTYIYPQSELTCFEVGEIYTERLVEKKKVVHTDDKELVELYTTMINLNKED